MSSPIPRLQKNTFGLEVIGPKKNYAKDILTAGIWKTRVYTRWAPTSYKWSYSPFQKGCNPSYPFIRLFIGVISPFRTIVSSGPPCTITF